MDGFGAISSENNNNLNLDENNRAAEPKKKDFQISAATKDRVEACKSYIERNQKFYLFN